jgi:hypothetical protein
MVQTEHVFKKIAAFAFQDVKKLPSRQVLLSLSTIGLKSFVRKVKCLQLQTEKDNAQSGISAS